MVEGGSDRDDDKSDENSASSSVVLDVVVPIVTSIPLSLVTGSSSGADFLVPRRVTTVRLFRFDGAGWPSSAFPLFRRAIFSFRDDHGLSGEALCNYLRRDIPFHAMQHLQIKLYLPIYQKQIYPITDKI